MISINTSSTVKTTDRSAASLCMLGASNQGTGLSGMRAVRPASSVAPSAPAVRERAERPTEALEAGVAQAQAYALAATGAGFRKFRKQTTQHHLMWAFRGPEPWSDPA